MTFDKDLKCLPFSPEDSSSCPLVSEYRSVSVQRFVFEYYFVYCHFVEMRFIYLP